MVNIALTGNPNVGKTSLFNRITHSLEHVGNWHGVTVEKKEKSIMYAHRNVKITDLPGLYSLTVYSPEEAISRDLLLAGQSDIVVNICDVGNLSRNLYLTLQLLELDVPLVLVINMMDELKKQGKSLNCRKLENSLRIPIVPMSAKYHSDVHLLMDVALEHIIEPQNTVKLKYLDELPLKTVSEIIGNNVKQAGFKLRYACVKVLENDSYVIEKLKLSAEQLERLKQLGDFQERLAAARYEFIDEITQGAVVKSIVDEHHEMHEHMQHNVPIESDGETRSAVDNKAESVVEPGTRASAKTGIPAAGQAETEREQYSHKKQDEQAVKSRHLKHHDEHSNRRPFMAAASKLDKILLNKYLALPIFLLLMAGIFVLTFGLIGGNLSGLLEKGITRFIHDPLVGWLENKGVTPWVVSLMGDGIINGVGGILVFLPQILLLFLFLAFLEDSGYISRVAFMTDGLFRKIGLSGRSVFTMLMGFGCSATAVLTARGLEDEKMRKKTVVLTPFMSCSARLPVYSTIAGAFFFNLSPLIIFGLYVLGAAVAIGLAAIFQKIPKLRSGKLSFIMEMPPYRVPTTERVFQLIWHNIKIFLIRVGTVVFALNVIVWALSSFSLTSGFIVRDGGASAAGVKSIMEIIAGFIAPVFKPLGFGEWRAVTALLSGLVAKELVISTIETLGGAPSLFAGGLPAFCFLVFTLLYCPCIATLAAMRKEVGFKWTALGFALQMGTAYIVSLAVMGIGLLFINYTAVAITVVIVAVVGLIVTISLINLVKKRGKCTGCQSEDDCPGEGCSGKGCTGCGK